MKRLGVVLLFLVCGAGFASCKQNDLFPDAQKTESATQFKVDPVFVAVGANGTIIYSGDGITWSAGTSGAGGSDVLYAVSSNGKKTFVAVGMGSFVRYSEDGGNTWIPGSGPLVIESAVASDGDRGWVVGNGINDLRISNDNGRTWYDPAVTLGSTVNSLIYNASLNWWILLCSGGSYVQYSDDWFATGATNATGVTSMMRAVVYANSQFIAVGIGPDAFHSPNGDSWTVGSTGMPSAPAYMKDIDYGNGRYIAVGDNGGTGMAYYYPGSGSWNNTTFSGAVLQGVAFGNNVWVAVGTGGSVYYSLDNGDNWIPATSGTPQNLNGVAFGYR